MRGGFAFEREDTDRSADLYDSWPIAAGCAFNESEYVRAGPHEQGKTISIVTPKHSGSFWVHYTAPDSFVRGLELSAGMCAVGKFYNNFDTPVYAPGYAVFAVGGSYAITPRYSLANLRDGRRREYWYRRQSRATPAVCEIANLVPGEPVRARLQPLALEAGFAQAERRSRLALIQLMAQTVLDERPQSRAVTRRNFLGIAQQLFGYFDRGFHTGGWLFRKGCKGAALRRTLTIVNPQGIGRLMAAASIGNRLMDYLFFVLV